MCEENGCSVDEKAYCMSMYGADGKFVGPKCDMNKCMSMTKEACAKYCDSLKCSPEEKAMCIKHAGLSVGKACCKDKAEGKACSGEGDKGCGGDCKKGCKTKEECMKSCGESCAKMH